MFMTVISVGFEYTKPVFLLLLSSTGNFDDFNLQDAFGNYYTLANFGR